MKRKEKARAKKGKLIPQNDSLTQFFLRMPFLARLGPVLAEMGRILCADENGFEGGSELPEYCHNILAIFRRTYFKQFPALGDLVSSDGTGQTIRVEWRKLGKMIGIALRCLRFGEYESQKQAGMTPEQEKEFTRMFFGDTVEPEAAVLTSCVQWIDGALMEWNRLACQWGPGALAELNLGVGEGMRGFINDGGNFAGETNRSNIFWFLLIAWPEIQEMQRARPPVSRRDFASWLEPFAKAGMVSIGSIEQLHDVCDYVGLKFKERGAPRKDRRPD